MKNIIFIPLLMIISAQAQVAVYDPSNYGAALEQIAKTDQTNEFLQDQNQWSEYVSSQLHDLRWMYDSTATEMRNVSRLGDWHSIENMIETIGRMEIPLSGYLPSRQPVPFNQLLSMANEADVQAFYTLLTNPEGPSGEKTITEIKKYKLHLALSYFNMAENELVRAQSLYYDLIQEDHLTMGEGDRILALQTVHRDLKYALDLKRSAGDLFLQAIAPNEYESIMQEHRLMRIQLDNIRKTFEDLFNE